MDSSHMFEITLLFLVSSFVVVLATRLVYTDTTRRPLARRRRLWWTAGVGIVSIGGLVWAFSGQWTGVYVSLTGRQITVYHPMELLFLHYLIGIMINIVVFFVYVSGSRFGSPPAQSA